MAKSIETREMHWLQNQRDWPHTIALAIQLTLDRSTISGSRMCRRLRILVAQPVYHLRRESQVS